MSRGLGDVYKRQPYTYVTEKQTEAMEEAHTEYVLLSLYEITYSCIKKLLADAE